MLPINVKTPSICLPTTPGNCHSIFCLYEFKYSRYLISVQKKYLKKVFVFV